jgi:GT2 family glycosyltransferase
MKEDNGNGAGQKKISEQCSQTVTNRNEDRLARLKKHPLWKASKPVRVGIHFVIRQKNRLVNCGGPRGVAKKLIYKNDERKAKKQFGTASFPNPVIANQQRFEQLAHRYTISILTPLYNTPKKYLRAMLESVMNQTYENWQLCLADGSDENHAYVGDICREYVRKSPERFRYVELTENKGISGNTNECFKLAIGEYIALLDHDDVLHPSALYWYARAIKYQKADFMYCDEATFKGHSINRMQTIHLKPDYAIDNLRANNYICHFTVFSRELLEDGEVFRSQFDGSQDHDLILRVTDRAKHIVHVPKVLYYWRSHANSVASGIEAKTYAIQAAKGAVADHLLQHGLSHFKITSTRAFETIFRIEYELLGKPLISILIPNKDHISDLKRCISSILQKSTYESYEIIIIENNSQSEATFSYYKELLNEVYDPNKEKQISKDGKITIVTYRDAFNYSLVNQLGASWAKGEYLLFLNNDTEVITPSWLEEMLMYAQRKDVGAVGAKLYYGDMTIQHAGVILGLGAHRTAGHCHYKQSYMNMGYMGRLCYAQDFSAVTGACMMVSHSLYDEVGGMDAQFAVSLNDVDFCLKLREKRYLNVFTPFAELYHYESASRGSDLEGEAAKRYDRESELFRMKWKKVLEKGDPYYNPNFSLDKSDFSIRIPED